MISQSSATQMLDLQLSSIQSTDEMLNTGKVIKTYVRRKHIKNPLNNIRISGCEGAPSNKASCGAETQDLDSNGQYESQYIKLVTRTKRKRSYRVRNRSTVSGRKPWGKVTMEYSKLPLTCAEFLSSSALLKVVTKKRTKRSFTRVSSEVVDIHKNSKLTPLPSLTPSLRSRVNVVQLAGSSCNQRLQGQRSMSALMQGTELLEDALVSITWKFEQLNLMPEKIYRIPEGPEHQGDLAQYGGGVMVPYQEPLEVPEKRHPRAQVNLDSESRRAWNLLMGNIVDPADGTHAEKEKWWECERNTFEGRAKSLIARMRLIQGHRQFSPWKGSVVDSVVGAFLTQNVADHLSSSAFMDLAAKFPPRSEADIDKEEMGNMNLSGAQTSNPSEEGSYNSSPGKFDTVNWNAVRLADVNEIAQIIRGRGMNNVLAVRIKEFLDRLVEDHGSIDLEWLRDISPQSAKDYLLRVRGLGIKSVECIRLLALRHVAFPVDVNVGRICVRLGWVPLKPLPESLQLHLLELYPMQQTIQKYLWPRLCKLDQLTLYELHYQMITLGKVLCGKVNPNCNSCPLRGDCKYFASAYASARLALPSPDDALLEEKQSVRSVAQIQESEEPEKKCEPIIEEPASPETLYEENAANDIEDGLDGIPTIMLNTVTLRQNIEDCIKDRKEIQSEDVSKALIAIPFESASIPAPKLKNIHRLRTEHFGYELPDSHPILQRPEFGPREPDDPSPYLLIVWMSDAVENSDLPPSEACCRSSSGDIRCDSDKCYTHNCDSDQHAKYVRGQYVRVTILIPCRTAMRGRFPLNGTYFQVNEVFADHRTSYNPISIPSSELWYLRRRMVYIGTSIPSIFKGLTTQEIQHCFWRGFVCVRGFDMATRMAKPLRHKLHLPASKRSRLTRAGAPAHEVQ